MALQIKKGTNAQRELYTPLVGELLYVTDHIQAGVDPIFVGDGSTLGGVAVGQNAVLSGTMEGNIDLNNFDIVGSGDLNFVGNINNTGSVTTKKVIISGNTELVGGESIVVAVNSTGKIFHSGDINVTGNIVSTDTIQSVTVESDLVGSVISSDSTEILVDADTNQFSGNQITLLNTVAGTSLAISGSSVIFSSDDPLRALEFGSPSDPVNFSKYDFGPDLRFSKLFTEGDGGVSLAGATITTTYKGELSDPDNIELHDTIGGMFYQSFNGKTTGPGGTVITPAVQGFAGVYGFVAETQEGASEGVIPTTFIVGAGEDIGDVLLNDNRNLADDTNDALKYTSKGVLKVRAVQLRQLTLAERVELNDFLASGSLVFVTDPVDGNGDAIGAPRLQLKINSAWWNISVTGAADAPAP